MWNTEYTKTIIQTTGYKRVFVRSDIGRPITGKLQCGMAVYSTVKVNLKLPFLTTQHSDDDCRHGRIWVWTTCPESLRSCALAGVRTRDLLIASTMPYRSAACHPRRLYILCWRELSRRRLLPAVTPAAGHLTTPTVAGLPGLCENFRPTTSKISPI